MDFDIFSTVMPYNVVKLHAPTKFQIGKELFDLTKSLVYIENFKTYILKRTN